MSQEQKWLEENESLRTRTSVYTRTMGYYRPINNFNLGKQGEHEERKPFLEKKCKEKVA